nr:hypothetical protein [Tanacetum cinerariifolium]
SGYKRPRCQGSELLYGPRSSCTYGRRLGHLAGRAHHHPKYPPPARPENLGRPTGGGRYCPHHRAECLAGRRRRRLPGRNRLGRGHGRRRHCVLPRWHRRARVCGRGHYHSVHARAGMRPRGGPRGGALRGAQCLGGGHRVFVGPDCHCGRRPGNPR